MYISSPTSVHRYLSVNPEEVSDQELQILQKGTFGRITNVEPFTDKQLQILNKEKIKSYNSAYELKQRLELLEYNIVTIESVTSGLIASTMTDIATQGGLLYGGFIVYNTDAKRKWAGVTTGNLYNRDTAYDMALGALINSSAMVSISITGNSTPYSTDIGCMGIADVGVAIRCKKKGSRSKYYIKTTRINVCRDKDTMDPLQENWGNITPINDTTDWSEENPKENCDIWINSHTKDHDVSSTFSSENTEYPTQYNTMFINNYIRQRMVTKAINFATRVLTYTYKHPELFTNHKLNINSFIYPKINGMLNAGQNYISEFASCHEPDYYILNNMKDTDKEYIKKRQYWPVNKLTNDGELENYNSKQALCNLENSKIFVSPNCPIETRFSNKKKRQDIKFSKRHIEREDSSVMSHTLLDDELHFHQRKSMLNNLDIKNEKER